ncbi:hypothetical protein PIB30_103251 [Stylosanthes scabra]|uniref:Uncharacterized protein n=1 Tax=Stylosanthes scabra TaxID=79078 RepID=A0ABU6R0K2_9FABA|nr:hypothetical protein [Stylosanthes scabra]
MGIVSIAGVTEDVVVKIRSLTMPTYFHVIRSTRHSKGGTPQVLLGRPTLQTAGFKLDYITNVFSFKVGNVEEIYHPRKPSAASKKSAHQVQLSKEDKDERKQSEEAKARLKKLTGLRSAPPHVKKKRKDATKKKVKIQKPGEDNSKEEKEEEKERRKLELKCKSVEDLIGKLYALKKVLHHNDVVTHHLVKDQSKWNITQQKMRKQEKNKQKFETGAMARPSLLVARPHDLRLPKFTITEATARPPHLNGALALWPWLVRTVSLVTFVRSYTSVWRVRAPLLARAHGRASA